MMVPEWWLWAVLILLMAVVLLAVYLQACLKELRDRVRDLVAVNIAVTNWLTQSKPVIEQMQQEVK
jgi:hypothetical protein